jgi:hypothetical protein
MKITGGIAAVWILLAMLLVLLMDPHRAQTTIFGSGQTSAPAEQGAPAAPGPGNAPAPADAEDGAAKQTPAPSDSSAGSMAAPAKKDTAAKTDE